MCAAEMSKLSLQIQRYDSTFSKTSFCETISRKRSPQKNCFGLILKMGRSDPGMDRGLCIMDTMGFVDYKNSPLPYRIDL